MIRAYAEREGIPYVDYHTPMAAADGSMIAEYTYDGVHPTEAGYRVMERILPPGRRTGALRQVTERASAPFFWSGAPEDFAPREGRREEHHQQGDDHPRPTPITQPH